MFRITPALRATSLAVGAVALAFLACTDANAPEQPKFGISQTEYVGNVEPASAGMRVPLCKEAGPPGQYHFHVDVAGGVEDVDWTLPNHADINLPFDGKSPSCTDAWQSLKTGTTSTITITEVNIPAGVRVAKVDLVRPDGSVWQTITGGNSVNYQVSFETAYAAKFYNEPIPLGKIGDFVWNDLNGNGIQDAGEPGIPGVTVTLSGAASATTTTDANGLYLFTGLAAGTYTVTVATPSGMMPTTSGAGADRTIDSNGSPTTTTIGGSFPMEDLSLDFGFVVGRIGDFVWKDLNNNGLQDAGEPGIPGVTVTLGGAASATTTTDANGGYLFTNLSAGAYTVTVTTPAGMTPTLSGVGANRAIDSNGSPTSTTIGGSFPFQDLTLDFGFVPLLCTDPNATNYGQAAECEYPPDTSPCPTGTFLFNYLSPTGELYIKYDQFPAPNDNSYGINAVGWPNGHKFTDLVGSDHAGFQLVDGNGVVKLSFNVDYLSANASAPSGYASLGVNGGDGKMLVGTATGITATTSLDRNLNNVNIPGLFSAGHVQLLGSVNVLVNSPPTDAAHLTYNISDPALAGWDFHDTYYVTISAAKLASIGFDPDTWKVLPNASQLHNSPGKACPVSEGSLSITKYEVKDKQVKITILNSSGAPAYVNGLSLTWPSATNGKLMQVKLDGDVIYGTATNGGSVTLGLSQLVSDQNKRKIDKGTSDVYTLVFEKNADPDLSHYTGTLNFGTFSLTVLPR